MDESDNWMDDESKRYWVVIHYEREINADDEFDARMSVCMGNTIVENATIVAREIPVDTDLKDWLAQIIFDARKEATTSLIVRQLWEQLKDYSLMFNGLPIDIQAKLDNLSIEQLENIFVEVLKMKSLDDLREYLT